MASSGTAKMLANHLKQMAEEPAEGFVAELCGDSLFEWHIYIEGPKDTLFEGGLFKLEMKFPSDFPLAPPKLRFLSEFWHPNVYPDGTVCMSILHPPGDDVTSGELSAERWRPTQSVTTIVLSLISLLNVPNLSSPANVDASVQWRDDRPAFAKRIKELIAKARKDVPAHIKIPHPDTDPEERARYIAKLKLVHQLENDLDMEDYDDPQDYDEGDEYEDGEDDGEDDESS